MTQSFKLTVLVKNVLKNLYITINRLKATEQNVERQQANNLAFNRISFKKFKEEIISCVIPTL